MDTWNFILITFGVGLIFSLLAILAERLLVIYGYARGNPIGIVIVSFVLAIFKQWMDQHSSFYIYALFIVFVGPIGVNRIDLANTMRLGRWWWKSENNEGS